MTFLNPTPQELKDYIRPKLNKTGYHWPTFEKQIEQESGWNHFDSSGNVKMSYTGSSAGVGQLNKSYYPEHIWANPYNNIDAAADTAINNLVKFGSYRKALAAYNWGPGNVAGYRNAEGVHPAWDGTREWRCPVGGRYCATEQRNHYLDVILGPDWNEPVQAAQEVSDTMATFSVGQGLLDLMASYGEVPATDEMYFKSGDNDMYSEAFSNKGNRYVYLFSVAKSFRFLAD